MKIPDEAIEATAETLDAIGSVASNMTPKYVARLAIQAAMPAIREAIAQEIEEHAAYTERQSEGLGRVRAFGSGLRTAARIVRFG